MTAAYTIQLPYSYDALEPYISASTVFEHYEKHHKGYEKKLRSSFTFENLTEAVGAGNNSAKQILLHNIYWKSITPHNGGQQSYQDKLFNNINFATMKNKIIEAGMAHFGSGWLWVYKNTAQQLQIISTINAEIPTDINKLFFIIDLWEHAYYIDCRSNRLKHLTDIIDYLIHWNIELTSIEQAML